MESKIEQGAGPGVYGDRAPVMGDANGRGVVVMEGGPELVVVFDGTGSSRKKKNEQLQRDGR